MKKVFAALSIATLLFTTSSMGQTKAVAETTTGYPQGKAYESGGYQEGAGMPVIGNWSQNVPFVGTEINKVKWDKEFADLNDMRTPVTDKDGNLYYTTTKKEIISLDKNGKERWTVNTEKGIGTSPVIGKDGTVYVTSGGTLYALNNNGETIWKASPGSSDFTFTQTPAIDKDGTIYTMESYRKQLYAYNPDGSVKWISESVSQIDNRKTPVISKNGDIYIKTDNYLYAFNKNGGKKWEISIKGTSQIALLDDGKIVVPDNSQYNTCVLRIINPDGTKHKEWSLPNSSGNFTLKSDYNDQILVQESYNLTSYNVDGSKNWTYQTTGKVSSTPLIDKNGIIYIASFDGNLTALHPDGKEKWHIDLREYYKEYYSTLSSVSFKDAPHSLSMDSNGTLYAAISINDSKTAPTMYRLVAIGDDLKTEEGNICKGYLEEVEQKIKDGSITKEEINAAQLRLSKAMYDLSQKENQ